MNRPATQLISRSAAGASSLTQRLSLSHINHELSYLERLETRLKDIESALRQVQQGRRPIQTETSTSCTSDRALDGHETGTRPGSVGPRLSDQIADGGIGVIDTAEDSIDGMGAIKFTDEEDWGYFGNAIHVLYHYRGFTDEASKGHRQTLPFCAFVLYKIRETNYDAEEVVTVDDAAVEDKANEMTVKVAENNRAD